MIVFYVTSDPCCTEDKLRANADSTTRECVEGYLQHTFRAPLALLSEHCTVVVGGARGANGVEMKRGWVALCHTP